MKNTVYIDGNFLLESGIFYTFDIHDGVGKKNKDIFDDVILCNKDGYYEVKEDGGSMFSTYYVKGGITMYGKNGSTIVCFKKEHEQTYAKYKEIQSKILQLLEEAIIPEDCKNYFYQQQYISLFANLEYFLYGTFMWETCQCYDSYKRVIELLASSNMFRVEKADKKIFKGEHNVLQEKTFVKCVKDIVYHHEKKVKYLYKTAFGFDVNLDFIEKAKEIRNDIVHRAGYSKTNDAIITMVKRDVLRFKEEIDELVNYVTFEIQKINEAK